jgi:LPXTG-motif cell wall-anchored protein
MSVLVPAGRMPPTSRCRPLSEELPFFQEYRVNRKSSVLRRTLAVAGAAFVGLAATFAVSAPASAHHPLVKGDYRCVDGQWEVTWSVTNSEKDLAGTLTEASYQPAHQGTTIKAGATLPKSGDGALVEKLTLPADATGAALAVEAEWYRDYDHIVKAASASLTFRGDCEKKEKPSVIFESLCDGSVDITLINPTRRTVTFTVNGEEIEVIGGTRDARNIKGEGAAKIVVTWGRDGKAEGGFTEPDNCATIAGESTCEDFTWEVVNPADGRALAVTFTPSVGEAQTVEVEGGQTKSVTFPGSEGLTVVVTAFGEDAPPVAWEKPDNCGGGGGGPLPVTGPKAGLLAGAAGALLALGAGLFVLARRRRISFTA